MSSLGQIEKTKERQKILHMQLEESQKEFESFRKKLLDENDLHLKKMERLKIERQVVTNQISRDMMGIYENIRNKKKGIAVSLISEQSCSACGHELAPGGLHLGGDIGLQGTDLELGLAALQLRV